MPARSREYLGNAGSGIGEAANPLETVISQLEADAGTGGLWISNQGDLQLAIGEEDFNRCTANLFYLNQVNVAEDPVNDEWDCKHHRVVLRKGG